MILPEPPEPLLDREPVAVFVAGLAGLVDLGLAAATALDWLPLTNGQAAAVSAFVTGAAALLIPLLRARVWAPATVRAAGIDTP